MTKARDLANGGFGLVLVKPSTVVGGTDNGKGTVSFSAAASVSLNGVFSSTYDFYRIVMQIKPTAGNNLTFRFRAAGSDNSGATAYRSQQGIYGGASAGAKRNDTSAFNLNYDNNTPEWKNLTYDVGRPYSADADKLFFGFGYGENGLIFSGGQLTSTTLFDGFTIIASTSTINGQISVYGYNK